jgi:hypothetical protein
MTTCNKSEGEPSVGEPNKVFEIPNHALNYRAWRVWRPTLSRNR